MELNHISNKTPKIYVNVYFNTFNEKFDSILKKIAEEYNGELVGGGYILPSKIRDLSFSFNLLEDAHLFAERVRAIEWVVKIEGHCEI